jgi:hypothetical protein
MVNHVHLTRYGIPGILQITAAGWDGQIFRMSRQTYFDWRESGRQLKETSAVYVLYADHFDKTDGKYLYVGQTGDPIRRGNDHEVGKSEWTAALIFTSSGDWMSATHVEAIEAKFINWAKSASRYTVSNGTEGASDPHAGKADRLLIDAYLAPIREVVDMAGIDIFSLNLRGIFSLKEKHPVHRSKEIICQVRIIDKISGKFEVLNGSELWVHLERDDVTPKPVRDQVNALVSSGQAKLEDHVLCFLKDAHIHAKAGFTSWELLSRRANSWLDANRQSLQKVVGVPTTSV